MKQKLQQWRDSLLEKVPRKNYTPEQKAKRTKKAALLGCLLSFLLLVVMVLALFPILEIRVESNQSHYTDDEIVAALDTGIWTPVVSLLPRKAEKRLMNGLLYLDRAQVKYSFPATLSISVHEQQPLYYFRYETQIGGKDHSGWLAVGPNLRVVDATQNEEEFASLGLTRITLPAPVLDQTKPGRESTLRFTHEKETGEHPKTEQDFAYITEFLSYLAEFNLTGRLTSVDLEEKFEVAIVIDGKYRIEFGRVRDLKDFTQKLELAEMILARGASDPDMKYIVCVGVDEPYLRPVGEGDLD